jgi:hypothetical protein
MKPPNFDNILALVIYKSPLRYISTRALLFWDSAAETYLNRLQTFTSKVLGIIKMLTRVTQIK